MAAVLYGAGAVACRPARNALKEVRGSMSLCRSSRRRWVRSRHRRLPSPSRPRWGRKHKATGMTVDQLDAALREMATRTTGVLAANFPTDDGVRDAVAAAASRVRACGPGATPTSRLSSVMWRRAARLGRPLSGIGRVDRVRCSGVDAAMHDDGHCQPRARVTTRYRRAAVVAPLDGRCRSGRRWSSALDRRPGRTHDTPRLS